MKVKTAELSGLQLDVAVALAIGGKLERPHDAQILLNGMHQLCGEVNKKWSRYVFSPSTDWGQCGPLIDQFKLSLYLHSEYEINGEGVYDVYEAGCSTDWFVDATTPDPVSTDPKVAICRAVVASKLGDEVDIPDELMEVGE